MRNRLLRACLLAFPRDVRRRDGAGLVELAEDLAGDHGTLREALGLVRGGWAERRRRAGRRRRAAIAVAVPVVAVLAWSVAAEAAPLRVEVEEEVTCAASTPCHATTAPSPPLDRDLPEVHRADLFDPADLPAGTSGTLAAAIDGEMLVCDGWGLADDETGIEADCDTVYDLMSMTKQFTAAAVLELQTMGRLSVTDRIGRFLPGVPEDKRAITIEQLLTHTSGLAEAVGGDYERTSRAELVRQALASELRSAPGTRYRYSNVGYSLLAAIVEITSGQGYEEFLAEHLLEPAGMTSTGYVLPDWDAVTVAVEYDEHGRPQGRPFDHPWAADGPYWNLRGNGGLLSTARDMVRWYQALEGDDVLGDRAKRELFRPRVREGPHADTRYAYGWVVADTSVGRVQWHNGGNGWSYGEVTRLPATHGFVFWATNRSRSRPEGWNLQRLGGRLTGDVATRLVRYRANR